MYQMKNVGSLIKVVTSHAPKTSAGETINGSAVDRQDFLSCVLAARAGAATGTPTSFTFNAKLQDSADGSTGWADITGGAVAAISADNGEKHVNVNLSSAKRYLRVVSVIAFTGGTSPALPVQTDVVLGGAQITPTSY